MKGTYRFRAAMMLMHLLLLPAVLHAGEEMPPVIPHPVSDAAGSVECLSCHQSGKGGAPVVSHPERKNCGQCHVRGVVNGKEKSKGKKKR